MKPKTKKILIGVGVVVVGGIGLTYAFGSNPIGVGESVMNSIRGAGNPDPVITEYKVSSPAERGDYAANPMLTAKAVVDPGDEWPSFNRTIYGDRFSHLDQINTENASKLQQVCEFDSNLVEANQGSPLVVEGKMIFTSAQNIYAIDPTNCKEIWKHHERSGFGAFPVNRGAAYLDGKLFRGYADGYVRAFNLHTGEKLWETYIGDKNHPLWLTMAPVAWDGMVYAGMAGGDQYDNRGRAVGLNAETGEIAWQTFTVPPREQDGPGSIKRDLPLGKQGKLPLDEMQKSWGQDPSVPITGGGVWTHISVDPEKGVVYIPVGNPAPDFVKDARPGTNLFTNTMLVLDAKSGDYANHLSIMKYDWHDWDMSNAAIMVKTRGGKDLLTFAPKDGFLYGFDRGSSEMLYREPKTKMMNEDVHFTEPDKEYHFCPGATGGGEWNGVAFDPSHNLLFTGMNDWCYTAKIRPLDEVKKKPATGIWFGVDYFNPYNLVGKPDPVEEWGGYIYASDADTGKEKWRIRSNYPTLTGLTPTAGGIMAFGDMGGVFRVVRSADGKILFEKQYKGGMAGGMITYAINGKQYIAFNQGFEHPQWPVSPHSAKVIIMSLPGEPSAPAQDASSSQSAGQ